MAFVQAFIPLGEQQEDADAIDSIPTRDKVGWFIPINAHNYNYVAKITPNDIEVLVLKTIQPGKLYNQENGVSLNGVSLT